MMISFLTRKLTSKKKVNDEKEGDLFDEDIFSEPPTASKGSKPTELISEEVLDISSKDDDTTEDLEASEKGETSDEETKEASKIKKPIGGVSMFGGFNPKSLLRNHPKKKLRK